MRKIRPQKVRRVIWPKDINLVNELGLNVSVLTPSQWLRPIPNISSLLKSVRQTPSAGGDQSGRKLRRAGIVREGDKEEEGLQPGREHHRWLQGGTGRAIWVSFPWTW